MFSNWLNFLLPLLPHFLKKKSKQRMCRAFFLCPIFWSVSKLPRSMNCKVCPMYVVLLKSSMMYWTCLKWASSICTIALLISSSLIYTTFCRKRFPQASLLTCAHQRLSSEFSYLPATSPPHLSSFIHLFSSVSLPLLLFHLPSVRFAFPSCLPPSLLLCS